MENIYKDLYQKKDLTFDEILIMLNNNYDPDKKLLLKLMECVNKGHSPCEYITFCEIVPKIIDKYDDIKTNVEYLRYAYNIKNIDIIKLLINKNAKISCLDTFIKFFKHDDDIMVKGISQIMSYEDKNKYIYYIFDNNSDIFDDVFDNLCNWIK